MILAKAGILDGLAATTHHNAIDLLRNVAPHTKVNPVKRFMDNGKVIVSAGISAGIDMSLYVIDRLYGGNVALEAARYMEYDWRV